MQVETLIIGGGIAGAAVAYAMRGENVLVVDAGEIANCASGNPKGFIKPYLSFGNSKMRAFYHAAYEECQKRLNDIKGDFILQTGIVQLPKEGEARFPQVAELSGLREDEFEYLTAAEASLRLGTECRSGAIYWRRGVVVDPVAWVKALLGNASVKTQTKILKITCENTTWHAQTEQGEMIEARRVVIATGSARHLLPDAISAQIRPRAGQISFAPADALPILPSALSFGHYWIPPAGDGDQHLFGATFDPSEQAYVTAESHMRNIAAIRQLAEILPEIKVAAETLSPENCSGRAAVRATTRDHLPLYGQAAPGLYYLIGLGSRGLMSAPYAAQLLSEIMD